MFTHPQVRGLTRSGDAVTEALSAALRVGSQQSKVSSLAPVAPRARDVSLAVTVATTLSPQGASQGAGAGLTGWVAAVAEVTLITLSSSVAWQTDTVSSLVTSVALLTVWVALVSSHRAGGVTLAPSAGPRVKPGEPGRSVVAGQTALTVDPVCLVLAVDANSSSGVFARRVEAPPLRLHLGVEVTLVRVAEALASLALVA